MSKKKKFRVEENETIDQCLDRIKKEGYFPVRRMEQPIFKEEIVNGEKKYTPAGREIIFEGKLKP
ncbi:NETI motif-containing protein [Bacillus aerolatus]|uniref:NETI motif-containing protein n=1 Tax=Bacillus aerolatus TaxID=2653354 RepID=A0A6I1FHS5_9BACI|nr:NETI motif-containing protein [Bacillus aerolatus]KAB7705242.1 NETI motif-containing protein [Bacillus aerolatus]